MREMRGGGGMRGEGWLVMATNRQNPGCEQRKTGEELQNKLLQNSL